MEGTKVLKCTCKHEEQDKMYGPGMRLHNVCDKKGTAAYGKYYCTVCSPRKVDKEGTDIPRNPALGMGMSVKKRAPKIAKSA